MIPFCIAAVAFATTTNIADLHLLARDWRAGSAFTAAALASLAGALITKGGFAI